MIEHAKRTLALKLPAVESSRFTMDVGDGEDLERFGRDFDFVCAFSVFTHVEHEDALRALRQCFAVLRRGGKVVCSVLPIETEAAKLVLLQEAAFAAEPRWQRVRNVTTSFALMEAIARLAGFLNFRWYRGDAFRVPLPDGREAGFRQSVLVGEKP
jgi:2-polyprenyl-3-methyl-5-hydroxy-6-metoxy-1,4-benzoquinol methylase